ncbi:MAG TPA: DUF4097 family beta strand repeat-containing protein [Gemmatimonas sp.]|uniref:DUF4097 family beta strand repeat-containing protein n=1 Tax=Gemmatimonas sp. TaxID=1962908 RepID=UPI002ED7F81B
MPLDLSTRPGTGARTEAGRRTTRHPHSLALTLAGAVASAVLVSVFPVFNPLAAQTERQSLSGSRVALYNLVGEVRIERGRGRNVEFEITRRGADARQLRIETGDVRGIPTLRVIYPDDQIVYDRGGERSWGSTESRIRSDGTWGGDNSWRDGRKVRISSRGNGLEAWADIRVLVPDGQKFDANLLVGELKAYDVDADLSLDAASARITAERVQGILDIDNGSGSIVVRDTRGPSLRLDTGSGGVTIDRVKADDCSIDTGSGGVGGTGAVCDRLDIDIGSGSVRLMETSAGSITVDAGSGGVTLDLRQSPRSASVESGSGSVSITVPSNFGATVDIETGSGGITTDFPITTSRFARRELHGTIGDGRGRLRVETGSGSVRLIRGS